MGIFVFFSSSFSEPVSIIDYVLCCAYVRECVCVWARREGKKEGSELFVLSCREKPKFCFLSPSSDRNQLSSAALSSHRRFPRRLSAAFPLSSEVYRKLSSSLLTIVISFIVVYANSFVENLTGDQVELRLRLDLWLSKIFIKRFLKWFIREIQKRMLSFVFAAS